MNICKEKESLEKLKNDAEMKYRQAIPNAKTPLGHDKPKGWTHDDKIKYSKQKQEYENAKEQCELHKKNCLICDS